MKRSTAAFGLALLFFLWPSPALGWDPFGDDLSSDPAVLEPSADPAPFIAPAGVYYVTDTYVADVVTSSGAVTTYSTATVHESTGSYARVLESVGTGVSSVYDGSAFNGRRSLADGRLVAGTYYENYVLTDHGFVPVSIVFFQDDAELADQPRGDAPAPRAAAKPISPMFSLLPLSGSLTTVEVLRGRAIALWPRAFVGEREVPVRSWTVVAGGAGEALATSGPGNVPFRSSWLRLAPPGTAYHLVFRIEVDTPETGHRSVLGSIAVVVRSPALEN